MLGKRGKPIVPPLGYLNVCGQMGFSPPEMLAWAQGTEGFL